MVTTVALMVLAVLVSELLAPSPAAAQSQESGFVPVSPARILDTRDDTHGDLSSPIGGDTAESTTVTGVGGVPAGASAVAINVTAVQPSEQGYLTIYPTGQSRPLAASINFPAGSIVGNQINVKVGSGGQVDIYNYQGSIDVVFDVVGYYHDQRVDGLESTVADQAADISALESTVSDQATEISTLESTVSDQGGEISALQALLAGVSRQDDAQGRDTLTFAGMNLQVVNGTGDTDTSNGLGNLIVGYDAERDTDPDKSGSHYLVVGDKHNYTAFGGILAGYNNTATGDGASVSGGSSNTASNSYASVSGGSANIASDWYASVSGGYGNEASDTNASVSGGYGNEASGFRASVSGGDSNDAGGDYASVSGGRLNTASGPVAWVSGGYGNEASGFRASVSGGYGNAASDGYASVSGGWNNIADGDYASVSGGFSNTADGSAASVSGGYGNTADGSRASILGGNGNTVSTTYDCHPACS